MTHAPAAAWRMQVIGTYTSLAEGLLAANDRPVERLRRLLSDWWRAWIDALGGANRRIMQSAYSDAYESEPSTSREDDGDR